MREACASTAGVYHLSVAKGVSNVMSNVNVTSLMMVRWHARKVSRITGATFIHPTVLNSACSMEHHRDAEAFLLLCVLE